MNMKQLEIIFKNKPEQLEVYPTGTFDEDFKSEAYPFHGAKKIAFYLAGVTEINSIGIREWIKWLNTAQGASFEFYECPKVIMNQINMVFGFLPKNSIVKSFYVPYYSEDSKTEKNILYTLGKEYTDSSINFPEVKDEAGNLMDLDVIEANYFKFLKRK